MKKSIAILLLLSACANTNEIYKINKEINSYKYIPDKVSYMKEPWEFYRDGGGDCEDFANTKRNELLNLGISEKQIKFVLIPSNPAHMVLEVKGLILDNNNDNLTPGIMIEGFRVNKKQAEIISKGVIK